MGGASSQIDEDYDAEAVLYFWFQIYATEGYDLPRNAIMNFQEYLWRFSSCTGKFLTKEKCSALTLIEYAMDYIRFILTEPSDFLNLDFDILIRMNRNIDSVVEELRPTELFDLEQSRRIEAACQDIFTAMKRMKRLQTDGAASSAESCENSPWQPFFELKGCFASDKERNFMMSLRHLYVTSRTLSAEAIYQQLTDVCVAVIPDQISLSDVSINTAIRTVSAILSNAASKVRSSEETTGARYYILKSFCNQLNCSRVLESRKDSSASFRNFLNLGHDRLNELLDKAYINFPGSRPSRIDRPNQYRYFPPLWKKLRSIKSLSELLRFEQPSCAICKKENIRPYNFAILGECLHVYCVRCIEASFERSVFCPYCRNRTIVWTTRNEFLRFKKNNRRLPEQRKRPAAVLREGSDQAC